MSIKPSDNLITLIDPENVTSEAFRILRTKQRPMAAGLRYCFIPEG